MSSWGQGQSYSSNLIYDINVGLVACLGREWLAMSLSNGGYGVAVARELVELSVWVQLPVVTPKSFNVFNGDAAKLESGG